MNLYNYHPHMKLDEEQDEGRKNQQIYFKIILWSTFGLAFVRFVGSTLYMCKRHLTCCFRRT